MNILQDRPRHGDHWQDRVRYAVGLYALAGVLCIVCEIFLFQLWNADLRVPFYYPIGSDVLHNLMATKNITENGSVLSYPRLGAPGTLDHHDYVTLEPLHYFTLYLIALACRDPGLAFNLFFLISFLLITWTSLFTMGRLGISKPVAVVASLLYSFLPYHFLRGQYHIFLSAYYSVPLTVLLLLRICRGKPVFFGWGPRRVRWGVVAFTAITCVLIACSGVYSAFFSLYFLVVASLIGFSRFWRPARLADGMAIMALIFGLVVIEAMPTFLYSRAHGKNQSALRRYAWESEHYALSFNTMLRPLPYHRFGSLARMALGRPQGQKPGNLRDFVNGDEREFVTLGMFGSFGMLTLLVVPFLVRKPAGTPTLLGPLWKLCLSGVLLGVPRGLGHFVALYVSANFRSLNRVSIFIGFFCVLATALLLDQLRRRAASPGRRSLFNVALGAILVICLVDQMPAFVVPDYERARSSFDRDQDYFRRIEAALPPDSMVFLLPFAEFPDGFPDTRAFDGGIGLKLMPSLTDPGGLPDEGTGLVVVAAVNDSLHFRIFDFDGKMAVDTDQARLTGQSRQVDDLRKQLENLWPPHEVTMSSKEEVIKAAASIVGYTFHGGSRGDEQIRPSLYTVHELSRAFFHTDRLRLSSPMMRGRGWDQWHNGLKKEPIGRVVEELTRVGFRGISIDRGGYDDRAESLVADLRRIIGPETLESSDHRFIFFPLKPASPPASVASPG